MDSLKLAGTLPPETERNGLDWIAAQVMKDPTGLVPVMMLVDCKSITERTDIGDRTGTLRIRRIEPVQPQDLEAARKLFHRLVERRTGKNALPIEFEDEEDAAFGGER